LVAGTDIPTSADTTTAILLTVTMIVSFSAMYGARRSRGTDSSARTSSLLITAAAFALATAIGTGIGWAASNVAASSPYGGVFYLTTGAHAIHLVIAAAFALGLSAQVRRGTIARTSPTHVDLAYWFWVFLLVLWLAIDAVFYVI
jgi:heme/copper-type cytochrome/quinol oxidase subunit 3